MKWFKKQFSTVAEKASNVVGKTALNIANCQKTTVNILLATTTMLGGIGGAAFFHRNGVDMMERDGAASERWSMSERSIELEIDRLSNVRTAWLRGETVGQSDIEAAKKLRQQIATDPILSEEQYYDLTQSYNAKVNFEEAGKFTITKQQAAWRNECYAEIKIDFKKSATDIARDVEACMIAPKTSQPDLPFQVGLVFLTLLGASLGRGAGNAVRKSEKVRRAAQNYCNREYQKRTSPDHFKN